MRASAFETPILGKRRLLLVLIDGQPVLEASPLVSAPQRRMQQSSGGRVV